MCAHVCVLRYSERESCHLNHLKAYDSVAPFQSPCCASVTPNRDPVTPHSSLPHSSWRPLSHGLSLWICLLSTFYSSGRTQHLSFYVWLVLLSTVFARFTHVVASMCQGFVIFFLRFYLFIFRERGKEGQKHWCARETLMCCLLHTPNRRPGPQPRHVLWPGIEPATFWFVGWATPDRASLLSMAEYYSIG